MEAFLLTTQMWQLLLRNDMEVSHNTDRTGFCTHCGCDIRPPNPVVIVKSAFRLKGEHWFCTECFFTVLGKMRDVFEKHFGDDWKGTCDEKDS